MSRTYWIKNSSSEWTELTGKEFYQLVQTPAGKQKNFIDFEDYLIEASEKEYLAWRSEASHADYLKRFAMDRICISIYEMESKDGYNGEDAIMDVDVNVEEVMCNIDRVALREALLSLSEDEYRLIADCYMVQKPKTERELAVEYGLSQVAVHKRKNKILKKLKFLVIKTEKS